MYALSYYYIINHRGSQVPTYISWNILCVCVCVCVRARVHESVCMKINVHKCACERGSLYVALACAHVCECACVRACVCASQRACV